MRILHLGRPTKGDISFYHRWEKVGTVSTQEKDPTIIVTDQYTDITDETVDLYPNVKYICSPTTGHTHLKISPFKYNIKLITLREEPEFMKSITSVSEFTIHLLLRCARELSDPPLKLSGKSIGIIGEGRVGTQVGAICEAMGMNVKYFDRQHNKHYLKSIFRYSDFISIHLSENLLTRNLINKMYIDLMRPGSFFINTARPSIVNELALYEAIKEKRIKGVASDVSEPNSPLNCSHPRIILTSHIGGRCLDDRIATDNFIIDKLNCHLHNTQQR